MSALFQELQTSFEVSQSVFAFIMPAVLAGTEANANEYRGSRDFSRASVTPSQTVILAAQDERGVSGGHEHG